MELKELMLLLGLLLRVEIYNTPTYGAWEIWE